MVLAGSVAATRAAAQSPTPLVVLTRDQAIAAAVARHPSLAVASADTSVAHAALVSARARQNPGVSAAYSKATPQCHLIADWPLGLPGVRQARIGIAGLALSTPITLFLVPTLLTAIRGVRYKLPGAHST